MILSFILKSILLSLVNILPYEVWLWDHNYGCGEAIHVLGLKTVNLTFKTKWWLAWMVGKEEMKPIVYYYGIGHRWFPRKERIEIGNIFTLKLAHFWWKKISTWIPLLFHFWGFLGQNLSKIMQNKQNPAYGFCLFCRNSIL